MLDLESVAMYLLLVALAALDEAKDWMNEKGWSSDDAENIRSILMRGGSSLDMASIECTANHEKDGAL